MVENGATWTEHEAEHEANMVPNLLQNGFSLALTWFPSGFREDFGVPGRPWEAKVCFFSGLVVPFWARRFSKINSESSPNRASLEAQIDETHICK